MSAATEAATAAQVGEEVAASQAAAANPARTFTAANVDAAEDEQEAPGGLEGVSATMLLRPAMWRISEYILPHTGAVELAWMSKGPIPWREQR